MLLLAVLLAIFAAPTAADVQTAEEARILEPLTDYTRNGRAYVEFAPTVETRNVVCRLISTTTYECLFDARVKDALAQQFGTWTARREQLTWRDGCWRQDPQRK